MPERSNYVENFKRVVTDKRDFPLSTIKEMCDDGDIIPQPEYQRGFVYDEAQSSKLVESALIGIPIPTIYLCEEQDGRYSVIDGQQRITSFVKYLKNEFKLKKLEELSDLNGKCFKDLDKVLQKRLKTSLLSTIILTKESQELKYDIFARLNQGSIALTPQELRNCIYRGAFNDFLEDTAVHNKYLPSLFISENKRKKYQEYILRFFALRDLTNYSSSILKTMNNYMAKHQNDDAESIETAKKLFNGTIDIIKQILGDNAFNVYDRQNNCFIKKFSGSVYDSIMIAFSMFDNHDLMMHADDIRNEITNIKAHNQEYQDYTYASTGSKDRVIGRILLVYNVIKDIIGKNRNDSESRLFSNIDKKNLWHSHYICPYCNQEILSIEDAEVDHIIPFSQGGSTRIDNAQLLHRHCNRKKYNIMQLNGFVDFEEDSNIE
jgi:hypothetical protein